MRSYYAAKVGAIVLLYGVVDSPHDVLFDPKGVMLRWDQKHANTAFHGNIFDNYSKYFPNQNRIHPDQFGKTIAATINSSGFRGRDFEKMKKPGVIRVVTLGASSTFGFRTRDDQTYPYYLEEDLNRSLPLTNSANLVTPSGKRISRYEVINLGIPHLESDQILSLFLAEAVPLDPDIVTFYEGYNDAANGVRDSDAMGRIKRVPFVTTTFRGLRHRLLTVAVIANKVFGHQYAAPDAPVNGFEGESRSKEEKFMRNLEAIYRECQKRHYLFIVANQQVKSLHVDREHICGVTYAQEASLLRNKLSTTGAVLVMEKYFLIHSDLMDAEREWARTNNVPFVDVIDTMDRNRQCLIDYMHLNAQGNQIVAKALSDRILAR